METGTSVPGRALFSLLLQVPVEQLLGELDALELEQLRVRLELGIQVHPDGPRLRERLRIGDRPRVFEIRDLVAPRRELLVDPQLVAVMIAGAIEPAVLV